MTAPDRAALWQWLRSAPLPVVLSICLSTTGALGSWVWAITGEVNDQKAVTAVAAEQAKAAGVQTQGIEARLVRLEAKLDRMLEVLAELKAEADRRARSNKERNR